MLKQSKSTISKSQVLFFKEYLQMLIQNALIAYSAQESAAIRTETDQNRADQEAYECEMAILDLQKEIRELQNEFLNKSEAMRQKWTAIRFTKIIDNAATWYKDNVLTNCLTESQKRMYNLYKGAQAHFDTIQDELDELNNEINEFLRGSEHAQDSDSLPPVEFIDEPFQSTKTTTPPAIFALEFAEEAFSRFGDIVCYMTGESIVMEMPDDVSAWCELSEEPEQTFEEEAIKRLEDSLARDNLLTKGSHPFRCDVEGRKVTIRINQ